MAMWSHIYWFLEEMSYIMVFFKAISAMCHEISVYRKGIMALSSGTESGVVRGHRRRDSSRISKISTYADTANISTMPHVICESTPMLNFWVKPASGITFAPFPSHSLAFFGPSLCKRYLRTNRIICAGNWHQCKIASQQAVILLNSTPVTTE